MREILSDLVAEEQHLDQFLQGLSTRDWKKKTPAEGWTIQDQVSHLAHVEGFAAEVIEQGQARITAENITDFDAWTAKGPAEGRGQRHQEVIEWWRHGRADVVDALSRMLATDRIPWICGEMSAKSFATMRLMETWAHGLDIKAAVLDRITPIPEDDLEEDEEDPVADTTRGFATSRGSGRRASRSRSNRSARPTQSRESASNSWDPNTPLGASDRKTPIR